MSEKDLHDTLMMDLGKISYEDASIMFCIHIACQNLPILNTFGVVYLLNSESKNWDIIASTSEVATRIANPEFIVPVSIRYLFEQQQLLKANIFSKLNDNYKNLDEQKYIGSCEFYLHDIIKNKEITSKTHDNGCIIKVKVDIPKASNSIIEIEAEISCEANRILMVISKPKDLIQQNAEWIAIYKTEVIDGCKLPVKFGVISIPPSIIEKAFLFEIFE